MKYKVSIVNQAEVTFNDFEKAYNHFKGRMYIPHTRNEVLEELDRNGVFRYVYGFYYGDLEKVA